MNATQETLAKRHYTPRKPVTFNCQFCSVPFESSSYASKFCTTQCRERARYARDYDKRLAAVQMYRKDNAAEISARARVRYLADPAKAARQARESYMRHRDKRVEAAIEYQKNNPAVVALTRHRRKAAESLKVTRRDHRRLLSRYRNRCAYCEVKLGPWGRSASNSLQWDHVLPLSKGGADSVGNLLPSCRECNRAKSAKLLSAWRYKERNK